MCDYCEETIAENILIKRRCEEYRLKYLASQKKVMELIANADFISKCCEEYRLKYLSNQKEVKTLQRKVTERGKKKKQDDLTKAQLKAQEEKIARLTKDNAELEKKLSVLREMQRMVMEQLENYSAALGCMNHTELQYRIIFERLWDDPIVNKRMKEMSIACPESSSGAYFFGGEKNP